MATTSIKFNMLFKGHQSKSQLKTTDSKLNLKRFYRIEYSNYEFLDYQTQFRILNEFPVAQNFQSKFA